MSVTIKVENTYEDGHESVVEVDVDAPEDADDLEDWWQDTVFPHTGDGHGIGTKLGSWHEVTIIRADDDKLVGLNMEWG
jgi:hypothetical protein